MEGITTGNPGQSHQPTNQSLRSNILWRGHSVANPGNIAAAGGNYIQRGMFPCEGPFGAAVNPFPDFDMSVGERNDARAVVAGGREAKVGPLSAIWRIEKR